jgi:hypothetical protein
VTGRLYHDIERIQTAQKYLKYSMASYVGNLKNYTKGSTCNKIFLTEKYCSIH